MVQQSAEAKFQNTQAVDKDQNLEEIHIQKGTAQTSTIRFQRFRQHSRYITITLVPCFVLRGSYGNLKKHWECKPMVELTPG